MVSLGSYHPKLAKRCYSCSSLPFFPEKVLAPITPDETTWIHNHPADWTRKSLSPTLTPTNQNSLEVRL